MDKTSTRRKFLGATAATAASGWAGAQLYAADAKKGPNDTINIGIIGCGARGRQVSGRFKELPGCRIIAACDVNSKNLGKYCQQFEVDKAAACGDFRKLLDNKNVDAVLVATQAHWHVLTTIGACQAGKDVYVEKPLSNSIAEGRFAIAAARKYNRIVQIGTQQRSWEQYRKAVEIIQSGELGEISEVKVWDLANRFPGRGAPPNCDPPKELDWDMYVGPAPMVPYNPNCYFKYGYDWFRTSGGGHTVAWGVHHFDIVNWAMGVKYPKSVATVGGMMAFDNDNRQWPDTTDAVLEYGPGPVAKKGFVLQYTCRMGARREFRAHAKCFFGTRGSLLLDRGGYTITAEETGPSSNRKKLIKEETFRGEEDNHQEVFLANVRNRTKPAADVEQGFYSTNTGHLINVSWLSGRKIQWDGENDKAMGDPEAQALVSKPYRTPWKLEV